MLDLRFFKCFKQITVKEVTSGVVGLSLEVCEIIAQTKQIFTNFSIMA